MAAATRKKLLSAAKKRGKAVLVEPVFDTIKLVEGGEVRETLDRDELRWPVAWVCRPEMAPASDPPAAQWFEGAAVVEDR